MKWIFVLLFPLTIWAEWNQANDFQIWQRNYVIKHIDHRFSFWAASELRWGDNASKFYYSLVQAQLYYAPFSWLTVAPGYQQIWTKEPPLVKWENLYVPMFDAVFRIRFKEWEIQDRNRLQYIFSDTAEWLYRNRFRIITPSWFRAPRVAVFLDTEFFWLEGMGVNEDRTSGGFMIQWADNWASELCYLVRFLHQPIGWIHTNVFLATLLVSF